MEIDTHQGKLKQAPEVLDVCRRRIPKEGDRFRPDRPAMVQFVQEVAKHEVPHAIPYLTAVAKQPCFVWTEWWTESFQKDAIPVKYGNRKY